MLCNCFSNRKEAGGAFSDDLKEAIFKLDNGITLFFENTQDPNLVIDVATNFGFGGGGIHQAIEFLKNYLHTNDISDEERESRYSDVFHFLNGFINFDENCSTDFIYVLQQANNNNHAQFVNVLAAIPGIRDLFYSSSATFTCDLRKSKADAANIFSNSYASLTWNALLQVQNTQYWLEWLRNNDPDFLYKASYYSPSNVSTYQTANNLYGGAYGGKQNYFVNLRNGLSQSTYDQIITYFLGQSSVYIDSMNLSEWHIYGSSRLGIYQTSINMTYRNVRIVNGVTTQETTTTVAWPSYTLFDIQRGAKRYELTNHLGNVLAVVSDKKIQVCTSTAISYYTADLVSATDYSPFGAPLAGRSYTAPNTKYDFGFNGKEKDNEGMGGGGSTYDYGFRIYNAQLGRFLSVDPLTKFYPAWTTYHFTENRPIKAIDLDGLQAWDGPNDINDVMSLQSFQQFTKTLIKSIDAKTIEKYQFDCGDFAYYCIVKYFEYKKVKLKFKVNNIEINSGNITYKDFDDFFERSRKMFGANFIHTKLSFRIKKSELGYGDLFTTPSHIEVNTPKGTEASWQVTISYGSGSYYGKDNPNNDVKTVLNWGPTGHSGGSFSRWIMLKDVPMVDTPATIAPRPVSVIPLVIPEVKSPEPPPAAPTRN
jgi:RHS repeat-associated protein